MNGSWSESHVRNYHHADINILTQSLEFGSVPVLMSNVDEMGLTSINEKMKLMNDLSKVEVGLGTFTMVNLGKQYVIYICICVSCV